MAPYDELPESTLCDIDFIEEFGSYLTTCPQINSEETMMAGSATNILSSVKSAIFENFKNNAIWDDDDECYTKLTSKVLRARGNESLPLQQKASRTGRALVKKICISSFT
jgi:hypothetical protein